MSKTFSPGQIVMATYRMPSPVQPWVHGFHFGAVAVPGSDASAWNGHNSEAQYCDVTGRVPVDYPDSSRQYEHADSLVAVPSEMIDASHADRVRFFLGEIAYQRYCKASRGVPAAG